MSDDRVRIRGTSEGLVITLGPGNLETLLGELDERLSSTASFFRGGRVALHIGPRELSTEDLEAIGYIISRNGVSLWAVIGDSAATQATAEALGLETTVSLQAAPSHSEPHPKWDEGPVLSEVEGQLETKAEDAALRLAGVVSLSNHQDMDLGVLVRRTLRSGQIVQHPGHVVVLGDVNPGAEIIAGGDVVVWGKLRGVVHAGAAGDDGAVVCALSLAPLQLRIGHHIARAPEGREGLAERPEMASVQDGEIVAEPWEK